MSWRDQAACRGTDWRRFFSDNQGGDAFARMREVAEAHCAGCPALVECAIYADEGRENGLWGGSYRTQRTGAYRREPLIPDAPLLELPVRAVGVHIGGRVA